MRVAITGASGLIGSALREEFGRKGWSVTSVTRNREKKGPGIVVWNPSRGEIESAGLEAHDAVIHLAGESLGGIWTGDKKGRILESRVKGTELIGRTIASLDAKPAVLLSASGVNYYGDRDPTNPATESDPPGRGFLADVCVKWEASTRPAADAGIRVAIARTAPVLTPDGGMLKAILPVFRLGLGAPFGDGGSPFSWIALDDHVRAVIHVLERELSGPVNLAAPGAVTNEEFTHALARAVNRPVLLRVPAWAARLAPGGMADEMLLGGATVTPAVLNASGFEFRQPALRPALESMLR
jgi:uncharacterized protein